MALTRRQLLKFSGLGLLGAVVFAGCRIPDREFIAESPVLIPEDLVRGDDVYFATLARPNTGVESVLVRVMQGRAKKIEGNPDYPMSRGKHSAQAEATLQELYHPDRIATPLRRVGERGSGEFESISWDEALNELTGKLSEHMDKPDSVAMITAPLRGALGTVVDRFAENYGARRFSFEAVDQTVVRTAFNRMYGQDRLPIFDVQNAHYVLSFGADFLSHWHAPLHYNWQYGEFRDETGGRGKLVQIEPRFSLTAANADKWVYVNPGTEGVLALAIAKAILENGDGHLDMMAALKETINARALPMNTVEELTGVKADVIETLAHDFAANQPGVAIGGGLGRGADQRPLQHDRRVHAQRAGGQRREEGRRHLQPASAHSQRRQHRSGQPAHGVPALRRRDAARRGQRGARARRRPGPRHARLDAVRPLDARERALHRQLLQLHGRNDPPGGPGPSRSGHAGVLGRRRPGTGPRLPRPSPCSSPWSCHLSRGALSATSS